MVFATAVTARNNYRFNKVASQRVHVRVVPVKGYASCDPSLGHVAAVTAIDVCMHHEG